VSEQPVVSDPGHIYARRGPYLQLRRDQWVDVRRVVTISETNPPDGPTRVLLDTADGHCLTAYRPLSEVVTALGEAARDWVREAGEEEELGRLMALDSAGVPEGVEPAPAVVDVVDRPWG
jgi:hypothetical protein